MLGKSHYYLWIEFYLMSLFSYHNTNKNVKKISFFIMVLITMFLLALYIYLSQNHELVKIAVPSSLTTKCNRSTFVGKSGLPLVKPARCNGSIPIMLKQFLIAIEKTRMLTLSELDTGMKKKTGMRYRYFSSGLPAQVTLLQERDIDIYWNKVTCIEEIKTVAPECEVHCNQELPWKDPFCVDIYNWGATRELCSVSHPSVPPDCKEHVGIDRASLELQDHINTTKSYSAKRPSSFVHIIKNGIIDKNGYVLVDQYLIVPNGCTEARKLETKKPNQHFKEIFVISQLWGGAYFHANIENIPRLAMYITFLKKFNNIKVHAASKNRYTVGNLNVLGIDKDRLVTGLVQGDVVYVPQGGGCGSIHQPSGHLLSLYYHHYIENHILNHSKLARSAKLTGTNTTDQHQSHQNNSLRTGDVVNCSHSISLTDQLNLLVSRQSDTTTQIEDKYFSSSQCNQPQNATFTARHWSQGFVQRNKNLILIKRSEKRWLVQHDELALLLKNLSTKNGLNFVVYSDEKLPSFNDTMLMFYDAVLIVAPHGAGLSNMIYSKPGTYIVEVLCRGDPNFCFMNLAQKQGMHYFGLASINECGPMKVDIYALVNVVQLFIKNIVRNT